MAVNITESVNSRNNDFVKDAMNGIGGGFLTTDERMGKRSGTRRELHE
jgi:hypothetical protein